MKGRDPQLVRPGWWCELFRHPRLPGGGSLRHTRAADRPEQALIWMRRSVRTLLPGFAREHAVRAVHWLDHGQWEAVMRLRAGEGYQLLLHAEDGSRWEWAARPVRCLRTARVPAGAVRLCPDPAGCVCLVPGHRCAAEHG
ncbi:hypothetical protein [Streptomyces sodiiphilus]